ncbi:MAG: DUF799 family lipoprotein [Deltaproteobacteria bacterium]|nr:DUF799 family lipoprotein [Deltaproteobacteria bacterium]
MSKLFSVAFLAVVAAFLTACAVPMRHYRPNPFNPVYTVAVLPLYNATNDVGGAQKVREEFDKRIRNRQYSVMPLKDVDRMLLDGMGVTLGDQLEMSSPQQLGELLAVDGVVYGYLLDFDDITTGLYNVKKVRAAFKLVETRTGAVIWSRGLGVKSVLAGSNAGAGVTLLKELIGSNDANEPFGVIPGLIGIPGLKEWRVIRLGSTHKAGDAAVISLGEKIITKALGVHLMLEASDMLNIITSDFPVGPGSARTGGATGQPDLTAPGAR